MKFHFTLAVWGDWHIDQLVRNVVPSLRAPGNLDAVDYHISASTRPSDVGRVRAALEGLNAEVRSMLPDGVGGDQGSANNAVHECKVRDYAAAAGEAWVLLSPDMVWGEGTLAHHRAAFEAGKTVIYRPLLRVDAERAGTITDFGKRSLARLALECEHNVSRIGYRANTQLFSSHAEMIIWPAPGGLLNKTISAELQTCVAGKVPEVEFMDPTGDAEKMLVVGDSDEAITLAMAPTGKDFRHVAGNGPLTPDVVRIFKNWFHSPATEWVARGSYRLHADDIDPAAWAEVEARADAFIAEVFAEPGEPSR